MQLQLKHEEIKNVVDQWWITWQRDAFPLFCPRRKWTIQQRNLKIGDIVLLQYKQKVANNTQRLAKVTEVHPDKYGAVRTVTVALRDLRRARTEKRTKAKAPQTQITVGVQRLVVLLPIEESWHGGLAKANLKKKE